MANPIRHKNIHGGTGTAALTDSSGTVPQVRRLRVGEWSLDIAIERESVTVEGYAYAVGGFDKSIAATGKCKLKAYSAADILSLSPNAVRETGKPIPYKESKAFAASVVVSHVTGGIVDGGVDDAEGKPMDRVASAPAVGEYALAETAGTYTFNASQTGTGTIYYENAGADGFSVTLKAGDIDTSSKKLAFTFFAKDAASGVESGVKVKKPKITKLSLAVQTATAAEYDCEFTCEADDAGDVVSLGFDH